MIMEKVKLLLKIIIKIHVILLVYDIPVYTLTQRRMHIKSAKFERMRKVCFCGFAFKVEFFFVRTVLKDLDR